MLDVRQCLKLLSSWSKSTGSDWLDLPDHPGLGCYGTGYDAWGVQANLQFVAAMATLASIDDRDVQAHQAKALAGLRFSLASHKTGDLACTDGRKWGHTPASVQALERTLFAMRLMTDYLAEEDVQALHRVLVSEIKYLRTEPLTMASDWFLKRMAEWDSPQVQASLHAAIESESDSDVTDDASKSSGSILFDETLDLAGKISLLASAAMYHFDLPEAELPKELLSDLWQEVKRLMFADGRLCDWGTEPQRTVRFCTTQQEMLPIMLLAANVLDDGHCLYLIASQLQMIAKEQAHNDDGSFFAGRLAHLRQTNPYYLAKLESDQAFTIAMAMACHQQIQWKGSSAIDLETSLAGGWEANKQDAVWHRSATRLSYMSWQSPEQLGAICLPPDDGHLLEGPANLCSVVRFMGDTAGDTHRRLEGFHIDTFEGGFATCGRLAEGIDVPVAEGWKSTQLGTLQMAFVALPDGQTMVGLHHCRTGETRAFPAVIKGMHMNLPNDLFNGYVRTLTTEENQLQLATETLKDEIVELNSNWVNIDHRLGVVGVYGSSQLCLDRSFKRRGGSYQSLHVDELCWHHRNHVQAVHPYTVILDIGFVIATNTNAQETGYLASKSTHKIDGELRVMRVMGRDNRMYVIAANFGPGSRSIPPGSLWPTGLKAVNLATNEPFDTNARSLRLGPSSVAVWLLDM